MPKFTPETVEKEIENETGPCGACEAQLFSDSGGLTQFGAFVEILPPGSSSSIKHWHAHEDEMIYMIEGQATVHEGETSYLLNPGDAATFTAGTPFGHNLVNNSDAQVKYLVIGTRSQADTVTYPDHDRILKFERDPGASQLRSRSFTTLDGTPADSPYKPQS